MLRSVFEQFGEVMDITIKKYDFDAMHGTQRGYGFIHFPNTDEGIAAALRCTDELRNTLVGDARYKCDVSHKLMKELREKKHPALPELLQRYPSFLKILQAREQQQQRSSAIPPSNKMKAMQQQMQSQVVADDVQWTPAFPAYTTAYSVRTPPQQKRKNFSPPHVAPYQQHQQHVHDAANNGLYGFMTFAPPMPLSLSSYSLSPVLKGSDQENKQFVSGGDPVMPVYYPDFAFNNFVPQDKTRSNSLEIVVDSAASAVAAVLTDSDSSKEGLKKKAAIPSTPFHTTSSNSAVTTSSTTASSASGNVPVAAHDPVYAIASPAWFHPWNQVMFPYASYASPAPFSPAPFGYSPMHVGMNFMGMPANNQAYNPSDTHNTNTSTVS